MKIDMPTPCKKRKHCEETSNDASPGRRVRRKEIHNVKLADDFNTTALMMNEFSIGKSNPSNGLKKLKLKKTGVFKRDTGTSGNNYTSVLTFGEDMFGQIGLGEGVSRKRPASIMGLENFQRVSCGGQHTLVVNRDGEVWGFGNNENGSLGEGGEGEDIFFVPTQIKGFVPSKHKGESHGYNLRSMKAACRVHTCEERIVDVSACDTGSLALSEEGNVYFFGSYYDSVRGKAFKHVSAPDDVRRMQKDHGLGNGDNIYTTKGCQYHPVHLYQNLEGKVRQIDSGSTFAAVVMETIDCNNDVKNVCMTWGVGESGSEFLPAICAEETGVINETSDEYLVPTQVKFEDNQIHDVDTVACGSAHLLVIARDKTGDNMGKSAVYGCGLNRDGQLGLGHTSNVNRMKKIEFPQDTQIKKIAAGKFHSLYLDASGRKLFASGSNDFGQLGCSAVVPKPGSPESFICTPTLIHLNYSADGNYLPNPVIEEIVCGEHHTFALTVDGEVYSWGRNMDGELGIGHMDDECISRPAKVDVLKGVNTVRRRNEEAPFQKAKIHHMSGGSSHSALIATLL